MDAIKQKIVQGATEQFVMYGVRSVTMDDIASALGISKRTIYEQFTNKKELLTAVVDHVQSQQECHEQQLAENAETILDEFFLMFNAIDERYQSIGKFTFDVGKYYPEIYEEKYHAYYQKALERLKDRMQLGIEQGVILPTLNLEFSTYMLLEMIYNVISRGKRIVQMHIPITDAFKYTVVYLLRGFSTDKGIRIIDERTKNWKYNVI
ncbi:MAG: TetR/AcrR family transcriptional regulator [Rikenellaceae bacterium]|nr:TetR/AcrR family transcriptional regulator [Rikenellaceae bacterium]